MASFEIHFTNGRAREKRDSKVLNCGFFKCLCSMNNRMRASRPSDWDVCRKKVGIGGYFDKIQCKRLQNHQDIDALLPTSLTESLKWQSFKRKNAWTKTYQLGFSNSRFIKGKLFFTAVGCWAFRREEGLLLLKQAVLYTFTHVEIHLWWQIKTA